jgi:hypothetical protein
MVLVNEYDKRNIFMTTAIIEHLQTYPLFLSSYIPVAGNKAHINSVLRFWHQSFKKDKNGAESI